ncbi:MAG: SIR2 family protein [Zhongshania sp.]|uniref:P-loop NTPase n=1 Tax=Zhongshania sp. TaxID=1971902 RepID=UPI002602EB02|nr:SIR2 family protein [Zhongshania sp.]MDF1692075.1 SIR2 family protein [Zhongshania sp.]
MQHDHLVQEIKRGRVALLFGSGALFGAEFPSDKKLLLGDDLKSIICAQFLGGEYKEESLQFVSELAISQAGLIQFQQFVADQFIGIKPADFHKKIPLFKWRALFTTNYDLLIEDSYKAQPARLQECRPIISQNDGIDESSRTELHVPLIKLHGCITRHRDKDLPLILTVEQYNDYMDKRKGLFNYLYQVAFENTMVFVGHSLKDANIRQIITMVDKECLHGRPRYYLVKPGSKQPEIDFWASKRVTVINCGLAEFINALDNRVSKTERSLSMIIPPREHAIQSKFVERTEPDAEILTFFENDAEYIHPSMDTGAGEPSTFYSGAGLDWFPIANELDVKRTLGKKLLSEIIESTEEDRLGLVNFYLIKGEAGSGKTILLRRLSYDAAITSGRLCIYISSSGNVNFEILSILYKRTRERIFIFWDNASDNAIAISNLIRKLRSSEIPVTIVSAERYAEWHTKCEELLEPFLTDEFTLPYLGKREIRDLVLLLEKYDCLGPALKPLSQAEREQKFSEAFGRQLLVALHEVTLGKRFEDIIQDEYESLEPSDAKLLYRTICVLNRLRVPVRAGLISRIAGITFEKFQNDFFLPLQNVVLSSGKTDHDVHYFARHPEIAEIVFNSAFKNQLDRYHEYIRLIGALNVAFETDKQSLRLLIRAKSLIELFSDYGDIKGIYDQALETIGREPYILQQMANYERIRDNGNHREAIELLGEARSKAPHDNSILHSTAVVWRSWADSVTDLALRAKYRREARSILSNLAQRNGYTTAIYSVLVKLALDDLEDLLADDKIPDRVIDHAIREAEKLLSDSKGRFPSEAGLLTLEAHFASILKDKPRAIGALKSAFEQDNRDPFVAIRLAKHYQDSGDYDSALKILRSAQEKRRSDHRINFALAKTLRDSGNADNEELCYFFQRSFSPGDQNHEAQFWFARFALESNDQKLIQKAEGIFPGLRRARVSHSSRITIRDHYSKDGVPVRVRGRMLKRAASYGFFTINRLSLPIMLHESDIGEDNFSLLESGDEAEFTVGYSYSGLKCNDFEFV